MTTREAFMDSVSLNQNARIYTVHIFHSGLKLNYFFIIRDGYVFLANEKAQFIYSVLKELKPDITTETSGKISKHMKCIFYPPISMQPFSRHG